MTHLFNYWINNLCLFNYGAQRFPALWRGIGFCFLPHALNLHIVGQRWTALKLKCKTLSGLGTSLSTDTFLRISKLASFIATSSNLHDFILHSHLFWVVIIPYVCTTLCSFRGFFNVLFIKQLYWDIITWWSLPFRVCSYHCNLIPDIFIILKRNLLAISSYPHHTLTQTQPLIYLFFQWFTYLGISYKKNHTVYHLAWYFEGWLFYSMLIPCIAN